MRIVIDMQGAQTESRLRGIGRYAMAFAQAVVRNRGENEILLALSGLFPDTIEPIRAAFDGLLPQENIRVWHAPNRFNLEGAAYRKINELIREAYLSSLNPDVVHFTGNVFDDNEPGVVFSNSMFEMSFPVTASIYQGDPSGKTAKLAPQRKEALKSISAYFLSSLNAAQIDELGVSSIAVDKFDINAFCDLNIERKILDFSIGVQVTGFDQHAKSIIDAWKSIVNEFEKGLKIYKCNKKLRLANVSPLPPERSGIADYCAELLPLLSQFYEVDVVTDQENVSSDWIKKYDRILTTEDFSRSAENYDRILYHFGNNPMHTKMFELLERFPGVVVLHDFFLSGVQWFRETHGLAENSLWRELYLAHGYKAVRERSVEHDEPVVFRYPCNFSVLQRALGIVVHSENSLRLAKAWYGMQDGMRVVPLLRHPAEPIDRQMARKELGVSEDDFLVCSFGFIGKTKQNHRLLDVWEASAVLSKDKHCKLMYIGGTDDSSYAQDLTGRVHKYRKSGTVKITGWTDPATYRRYLAAADVAVQLRTLSRGETSAAVLDCMNYAIATVINANGSMADIPDEVVRKIPDEFLDSELMAELEFLRTQPEERQALARRAQKFVHTVHAPDHCADGYVQCMEAFYLKNASSLQSLLNSLAQEFSAGLGEEQLSEFGSVLAQNFPGRRPSRNLFLDVSVVARDDFKTGIQRAVRALTLALIHAPPEGFRIEPVYLSDEHGGWHYRYARDYTLGLLSTARGWINDERIEAQPGDILLGLDLAGGYVIKADREGVYRDLRNRGVQVSFVVYDLIPVQFDNIYPPGFKDGHFDWLKVVSSADSVICISKSVADDLAEWVAKNVPERAAALDIRWFHLGADLNTSSPSTGLPKNASQILERISSESSFLMVGTVEPRKGHGQVLDAFDELWSEGCDLNLVVVGKEGWMVEELAERLQHHPELNKRLFWLKGISDEYLEAVYAASTCLIAASYGEGFGLPLIEAAQHKLPIIARDIPVFREVAGEHAYYFTAHTPEQLAESVRVWLSHFNERRHPESTGMPWLTWAESAQQLTKAVLGK